MSERLQPEGVDINDLYMGRYVGGPNHVPNPEPNVSYGPPGSYVDVAYGATQVIAALSAFGYRNQRRGFRYASNMSVHNREIWATYRQDTPAIQSGAAENHQVLMYMARHHFWWATGFTAMRGAKLMTNVEIDHSGIHLWERFADKYSGTEEEAEARNQYRKKLRSLVKAVQPPEAEKPKEVDILKVMKAVKQRQPLAQKWFEKRAA